MELYARGEKSGFFLFVYLFTRRRETCGRRDASFPNPCHARDAVLHRRHLGDVVDDGVAGALDLLRDDGTRERRRLALVFVTLERHRSHVHLLVFVV